MPESAAELAEILAPKCLRRGVFRGGHPETTMLAKVYGGQVMGQSLAAAYRMVPEDRSVHSLHCNFLGAGDTRIPIDYHVETLRDGASFSSRRVTARQGDRIIFHCTASFHVDEPGFAHSRPAPLTHTPEDALQLADVIEAGSDAEVADRWRREWRGLETRYIRDDPPQDLVGKVPAVQRLWIKTRGELPADPRLHTCALAYLSDLGLLGTTLAPYGYVMWPAEVPRASLDHVIWFHRPVRADGWMLFDQSSGWAGGARGLATGTIFDEAGELLATTAQEGLIRPTERAWERHAESVPADV